MATTTNYGWTTPNDTDLVKDGAAAIRTLGSSVDTTTKALNPSTTLGDIEYRSATANTNTRLGIGTTGQVLTVAGGVPSWAAASGGANWSLLNAGGTALTGATTITVSGISNADKIFIRVSGASTGVASNIIRLRFNTDSSTNYDFFGTQIVPGATYSSAILNGLSNPGGNSLVFGRMSSNASSAVSGYALLSGCSTSGVKQFQLSASGNDGGGDSQQAFIGGGIYNSSSAITSISVVSLGSNFSTGSVFVYTSA